MSEQVKIERDIFGALHIFVGEFDLVQVQYQHPVTDNASTRLLAERIARIISGTDDYATLQAELDNSKDEARQLRSQLTSLRSDAELGAAIEQACGELPEGYILTLDLERHGYGISLGLPDTDAVYEDSDFAGDSLAGQIRDAIDRAKALNEGFIDE